MSLNKKTSWPFKFNGVTKHIRNKMNFWVVNVKDEALPIRLTKADYDDLMKVLPRDYMRIGTPIYEGREIKRIGED